MLFLITSSLIKRRVARVEVLGVEMLLRDTNAVAEALIVHDLTLSEEFYRVADVGIVCEAQNVVISRASLLLC